MAIFIMQRDQFGTNVTFGHVPGSIRAGTCVFKLRSMNFSTMLRTSTLPFALLLFGNAHAQLAPQVTAPLAAHLLEVNAQWKAQDQGELDGSTVATFTNEAERIATHLRLVREQLMQRQAEGLSAAQVEKRVQLLDRLAHYANDRRFPQNHVLPYRNPVFIDPYGTACAVGWLMIESGHRDLAEEISTEMNLAYVLEMPGTRQWPAIAAWASEHGFEVEELAWIQPGYPPNVPWAPFGGGTDGPVDVLLTLANGNVLVGGNFAEAGGNAARQVALWNGSALMPLGDGLEGEVHCAVEFNGELYVGGSMFQGISDLAKWNGNSWEFSIVTSGKLPRINALHVHNGALHAAGEVMGFAGIDHRVLRFDGTEWQPVGQVLNDKIHALESFSGGLIAGGAFTAEQWSTEQNILRVARLDGSDWVQLGNGLDATVRDLIMVDGTLHAAGDLFINILPTFGLAKLQAGNTAWEHLLPNHANYMSDGIGPSYFNAMVQHNGNIHLVGNFFTSTMLSIGNNVAVFNGTPDGLDPLAYLDQRVHAVAIANNRLIIGGEFNQLLPYLAAVDLSTSIMTPAEQLQLRFSPVPTNDVLYISWSGPMDGGALVQVVDAQGRSISMQLERSGERMRLDVSALAPGMYVASMLLDGRPVTGRFIKS